MNFVKDKEFKIVLLVSIAVAVIFSFYLILIGIPLTNARNLTIDAVLLAEEGRYTEAVVILEQANEIQTTKERLELLRQYKEKL
jgi:hypothetical protein